MQKQMSFLTQTASPTHVPKWLPMHFHVIFINREQNFPSQCVRARWKENSRLHWEEIPSSVSSVLVSEGKSIQGKAVRACLCWCFPPASWHFPFVSIRLPHFPTCTLTGRFAFSRAPEKKLKLSQVDFSGNFQCDELLKPSDAGASVDCESSSRAVKCLESWVFCLST